MKYETEDQYRLTDEVWWTDEYDTERHETVTTDYADESDDGPWEDLSDDAREIWRDYLTRLHECQCRRLSLPDRAKEKLDEALMEADARVPDFVETFEELLERMEPEV
jgi:hypothetical protein